MCAGIEEKLKTFLGRPLEGDVSAIPSNVCQMPRFLSPRIKIARAQPEIGRRAHIPITSIDLC